MEPIPPLRVPLTVCVPLTAESMINSADVSAAAAAAVMAAPVRACPRISDLQATARQAARPCPAPDRGFLVR